MLQNLKVLDQQLLHHSICDSQKYIIQLRFRIKCKNHSFISNDRNRKKCIFDASRFMLQSSKEFINSLSKKQHDRLIEKSLSEYRELLDTIERNSIQLCAPIGQINTLFIIKTRIAKYKEYKKQLVGLIKEISNQFTEFNTEFAKLTEMYQKQKAEIVPMQTRLKSIPDEISIAYDKKNKQIDSIMQHDLDDTMNSVYHEDKDDFAKQIAELDSMIDNISNQLSEKQTELQKIKENVNQTEIQYQDLIVSKTQLETDISEIKTKIEATKSDIEKVSHEADDMTVIIENQKREIEDLTSKTEDQVTEQENLLSAYKLTEQELRKTEDLISQSNIKSADFDSKIEQIQSQIDSYSKENESLQAQLNTYLEQQKTLQEENKSLEEEISQAKQALNDKSQENQAQNEEEKNLLAINQERAESEHCRIVRVLGEKEEKLAKMEEEKGSKERELQEILSIIRRKSVSRSERITMTRGNWPGRTMTTSTDNEPFSIK